MAIYGYPLTVQEIGGVLVWRYDYVRWKPKATNFIPIVDLFAWGAIGTEKVLEVHFKNNVVSEYAFRMYRLNSERGNVYTSPY